MQFIHNDLGHRNKGDIIEITLTNGANVRLMDSTNFSNYRNGRPYKFHGGLVKRSPLQLPIPQTGRWHVAVDMQGLRGNTKASVRILPIS